MHDRGRVLTDAALMITDGGRVRSDLAMDASILICHSDKAFRL